MNIFDDGDPIELAECGQPDAVISGTLFSRCACTSGTTGIVSTRAQCDPCQLLTFSHAENSNGLINKKSNIHLKGNSTFLNIYIFMLILFYNICIYIYFNFCCN